MSMSTFKLNKNILISFASSISNSAITAQILSEQADYLNTTYTLMVDYIPFTFPTFGGLYYLDNRKKYLLKSGQTDKARLRHDLVKILASLGITESYLHNCQVDVTILLS